MTVETGRPAAAAGVQESVVLISFAGQIIDICDDLHRHLLDEKVGQHVDLPVIRWTDKRTLSVIPGEHPDLRNRSSY